MKTFTLRKKILPNWIKNIALKQPKKRSLVRVENSRIAECLEFGKI